LYEKIPAIVIKVLSLITDSLAGIFIGRRKYYYYLYRSTAKKQSRYYVTFSNLL